jgi:hypothetical protein
MARAASTSGSASSRSASQRNQLQGRRQDDPRVEQRLRPGILHSGPRPIPGVSHPASRARLPDQAQERVLSRPLPSSRSPYTPKKAISAR